MARSEGQKLKLLYLRDFLLSRSDEQHPVSVNDMIAYLAGLDVHAERKSIYDDLEALRLAGLDIVQIKSRATGYYVASRDFELPELQLLVDAVQSSRFITERKTLSLIRKLEGLCSRYEGQKLQRQVFVRGRVKSMNESVYYNVDRLSDAIAQDRSIRFRYFEYDLRRARRFRRDGAQYAVSPYALLWDNENYYLLGWDEDAEQMKHFRVDKLSDIAPTQRRRSGREAFAKLDMSAYGQSVFGMFGGRAVPVTMRFRAHLVGAVLDRFGKDAPVVPDGETQFTVTVPVVPSPQFYGWVCGFGAEAEILSPPAVRSAMAQQLRESADMYEQGGTDNDIP